jgi:hypothetical protein
LPAHQNRRCPTDGFPAVPPSFADHAATYLAEVPKRVFSKRILTDPSKNELIQEQGPIKAGRLRESVPLLLLEHLVGVKLGDTTSGGDFDGIKPQENPLR